MSVCPNCGENVPVPISDWLASDAKTENTQGKQSFFIMLFECPKCAAKFTSRVLSKEKPTIQPKISRIPVQTANVKNKIDRLNQVRETLMQTLKDLREKIKLLEAERAQLVVEVESLRKAAESRVAVLEGEVGQMREEAKSLRELLGSTKEPDSAPNLPKAQTLPKPS